MIEELKKHFFWKYSVVEDGLLSSSRLSSSKNLLMIVRVFYGAFFYFMFRESGVANRLAKRTLSEPVWSLTWIDYVNYEFMVYFLVYGTIVSLVFAIVFTDLRSSRLLVFVFFFFYASLINSFGKINHGFHHILIPLFGFVFLPSSNEKNNLKSSIVFLSTVLFLLFAYSISGWWKLEAGVAQFLKGEVSIFSIDSLSSHLARRLMETNETAPVGDFLVHHPIYGAIMMLSTLYFELFAVLIFFRPSIHRLWGVLLAFMHLGIYLCMNINFGHSVLALAVLLMSSPFDQGKFNFKKALYELPLFGSIISAFVFVMSSKDNATVYYDGNCGVCDGLVQLLLKNRVQNILFSPLKGVAYHERYSDDVSYVQIDTVLFTTDKETWVRSQALTRAFLNCKGSLKLLGFIMAFIPSEIMDVFYMVFAPIRKKVIRHNSCTLPTETERTMFIP